VTSTRADVATEDFGRMLRAFLAASKAVWNDGAVWIEERDRAPAGPLLAWPLPMNEGTHHQQLLAVLFNSEVEMVLALLELRAHPARPAIPQDYRDPKMQVVLRVMHRALNAGEAVMVEQFGDGELVSGRREFRNEVTRDLVDFLIRSGLRAKKGDEVFPAVGLSRTAAYRAMKRKPKRPRR
jgi:hypothetical protein